MMRAFIAAEISEEARVKVARLQDNLQSAGADVKWVEPRNLHLTLKFLGEIDKRKLPTLTEALTRCVAAFAPFPFWLEGVGTFPRPEHPRVIWVGVSEGKENLIKLAQAVEKVCNSLGFTTEERPFSPHLTIGRVRTHTRLEAAPFKTSEPTRVDRLVLFQSTLSPQGPRYTPVAVLPFRTSL